MGVNLQSFQLLIPALIPSWRFFDVIAPSPRIEYSVLDSEGDQPDQWQEFLTLPARLSFVQMLGRLFWNPDWNEKLFLVSLAERIADEPNTHSLNEISARIKAAIISDATYFQFRLRFVTRDEDTIVFISPVQKVHTP